MTIIDNSAYEQRIRYLESLLKKMVVLMEDRVPNHPVLVEALFVLEEDIAPTKRVNNVPQRFSDEFFPEDYE